MKNKNQKKGDLGQHWTPKETVDFMIGMLSKNKNISILEPTAGSGNFIERLIKTDYTNIKAVEIDNTVVPDHYRHLYDIKNFFFMGFKCKV